ncbi:hypothetical protein B1813_22855 [Saccharomonospora piscinae]|uniref:TrwC relaxase n=1 Tax=Saccharomonospora piscinae TaxID=687388 RepID=A0A1V8ZVS9_SACPI|nr:hypothetical protein [Saccharomonospora piscinae]OQO88995.1 hypothetical protein B1813_22855 [Saccharomonospora piscinae]
MLHTPSTSGGTVTAIFEAPETVAIALRSAHTLGNSELVGLYLDALRDAQDAAAGSVLPQWTVQHTELHLAPQHDPTIPQPHVHLQLGGIDHGSLIQPWAISAHERFQSELRRRVPGSLVDQPHPPGWEIRALLPKLGSIGRHRCLPPSAAVVYPADLATPRSAPAAGSRIA